MEKNMAVKVFVLSLALGCLVAAVGGCRGIPAGTSRTASVGTATLRSSGAGIVKADAGNVTYKIKCGLCGYEAEAISIGAPVAGKPYASTWICPKCGHKQKVVVEVVPGP